MAETDPDQARNELKKVKGHIVLLPLHFMENESSIIPAMGKEMFLPVDVWIQCGRSEIKTEWNSVWITWLDHLHVHSMMTETKIRFYFVSAVRSSFDINIRYMEEFYWCRRYRENKRLKQANDMHMMQNLLHQSQMNVIPQYTSHLFFFLKRIIFFFYF